MITIKRFNETDVTVEDGVITITQMSSSTYSTSRIDIPVCMWDLIRLAVEDEMAKPVKPAVEEA